MRYNPLEDIHNDLMQTRHQNMRYHANLLFTIIDGLTFNTQFVYEINNRSSREYASADSYKYRQMRKYHSGQWQIQLSCASDGRHADYWKYR